jgi:hypothetical protein
MPIEQKHYDKSGRYTGKSTTKTQDEIKSENEASAELASTIFKAAVIFGVIWFLFTAVIWVSNLLSNPSALSLPHKLFAYYYHYFFKFIYFVFTVIKPILVLAYNIPAEYMDFIKGLTRFSNFNLVLWVVALIAYAGLLLIIASAVVSAVGSIDADTLSSIGVIAAIVAFVPVAIWIIYYIFELIFKWLFR